MADNTKIPGPADRHFINIHQDHEVAYWCELWGITKAMLVAAVNAVGTSRAKVEAWLKANRYI